MDIKKINKSFKKHQVELRNKYYGDAIHGLVASGRFEDNDELVETAFEIAVKAVHHQSKFEGSALNIFSGILRSNS